MSSLFPIFMKLKDKHCLVVGAGKVGEPKIDGLLGTGAHIRVVAPSATDRVKYLAREGNIRLELREFEAGDLTGVSLAVVATASRDLNEAIYLEAQRRGILCNVVDVPDLCDFYYGAVVRRGDLQIAISTNGESPSLAQKLRQQFEGQIGPAYGPWLAELGATRKLILASDLDAHTKSELLHSLSSRDALYAALAEKFAKEASENEVSQENGRRVTV